MSKLNELKSHLKRGKVYRRKHLDQFSKSVDRDLKTLVQDGTLQKIAPGMYHYPALSSFGPTPAKEEELVRKYLDDNRFLLMSPNLYDRLGVGTTQLYNTRVVYNNKRHGEVMFGNRKFSFQRKPHFPNKVTPEYLAVDLVNNLDKLAEDKQDVLQRLSSKLSSFDMRSLKKAISAYGSARAKRSLHPCWQREVISMPVDYLHKHKDFTALLRIIEEETGIAVGLVEKDYWIMHVLYGLKLQGFKFELKGGTSLSKGYGLIDRFSEDIDIHIKPGDEFGINENPNNTKSKNVEARKAFYNSLAETISIVGITSIERDTDFDDEKAYRSGGIRLYYNNVVDKIAVLKDGVLLEAGFDTVTPNKEISISSWAYERAAKSNIAVIFYS